MPKKAARAKLKKSTSKVKPEKITPRRVKQSQYKSFRLSKKIKHTQPKIKSSFKIFGQSIRLLLDNWKTFLVIAIIYAILSLIFVRGFSSLQLDQFKSIFKDGFTGGGGSLFTSFALFGYLLGSSGASSSPTGGVYQSILFVVVSLATIWCIRQFMAGNKVRARDGFYLGEYPLIPFILVILVIGLQLLPLVIGGWLYLTVVQSGAAVGLLETTLWAMLALLLATLSLYMVSSSVFGLYIVTLPEITPMKALRSARDIVLHRRWEVIRKILLLPLMVLLVGILIMLPFLLFATGVAEWVYFLLSMASVLVLHSYLYNLYRELL